MATTIANLLIKLEAETTGLTRSFSNVSKIAAGLGVAVGAAAVKFTQLAGNTEQTIKSFKTFTGSQAEAIKLFEELNDFSISTPFQPEEVQQAAKTLLAFGRTAGEVGDDLRRIGELAAAAGRPIGPLAEAFGKANARFKVTNETLELFTNNGVPILEILAEKLGTTQAAVIDLASSGQISFNTLNEAIQDVTDEGGRFAGSLLEQSQTLNGLISTVQGKFSESMRLVGEKLLPAAKEAAIQLSAALDGLLKFLESDAGIVFADTLQAVFRSASTEIQLEIENIKKTFLQVAQFLQGLATGLADSAIGNVLFSDETVQNSINNLAEIESKLAEVDGNILELETSGNRFKDVLKEIALDNSLARLQSAVDDLNSSNGFKTTEDDVTSAGEAIKMTKAEVDRFIKSMEVLFTTIDQGNITDFSKQAEDAFNRAQALAFNPNAGFDTTASISGGGDIDVEGQRTEQLRELANQYVAMQEPLNEYINTLDGVAEKQAAINALTSAGNVALLEAAENLTAYAKNGGTSLKEFANVALQSARKAVGAFIREGVAGAVSKALSGLPFPANIAAGAIAGALAQTLFNKLISNLKIPAFGDGGLVTGPTLALVGEKGPELITPLSQLGRGPLDVRVTGEIEGNKLKLLMDRYDQIGARKFT